MLVDTILGLWATVLENHVEHGHCAAVYSLIRQHEVEVFPPEYFGELIGLLEARFTSDTDVPPPLSPAKIARVAPELSSKSMGLRRASTSASSLLNVFARARRSKNSQRKYAHK